MFTHFAKNKKEPFFSDCSITAGTSSGSPTIELIVSIKQTQDVLILTLYFNVLMDEHEFVFCVLNF